MKTFIIGIIFFIILSINVSSYASVSWASWEGIGEIDLSWQQKHCIEEIVSGGTPQRIRITNINDDGKVCDYLNYTCKVRWLYEIYVNDRLIKRGFIYYDSYSDSWINPEGLNFLIERRYVKFAKYKVCFSLSADYALRPHVMMTAKAIN